VSRSCGSSTTLDLEGESSSAGLTGRVLVKEYLIEVWIADCVAKGRFIRSSMATIRLVGEIEQLIRVSRALSVQCSEAGIFLGELTLARHGRALDVETFG